MYFLLFGKAVDRLVIFSKASHLFTAMIIPFPRSWAIPAILASCSVTPSVAIDQKNDDICALYGRYCTDDAVPLQLLFDLVFSSKTCGIDENIFISIVHDRGIDRIARRSGDIGYDDTVRAQQFC